ncbi:MAG: hypothetical protein ACR2P4_10110 [Gammaproteobacteria bacterium]
MIRMKRLFLPLLFLMLAPAMAHAQGGVVDSKAEVNKAADEYVKQCADNVRASRDALRDRHRNERQELGKPVNLPEYRALQEQQKEQRDEAETAYREYKKRARKDARQAKQENRIIRAPLGFCYFGDNIGKPGY